MKMVIIDYGAGNVRSVQYALERLGIEALCSFDIDVIAKADKLIFPGVGEASTAMKALKKQGLDELIPQLKQPVLGICLGMQLMCSYSEEGNTNGLNIFPDKVLRFNKVPKVPHTGWNDVYNLSSFLFNEIPAHSYAYFVHGYYVPVNKYTIATCDYGPAFSAALRKDNFYGCQFHPEKSAEVGMNILRNFITL